MCHLILFLPIFALPVFWLLPIDAAIAVYALVLAVSIAVYGWALKALHAPVVAGIETLTHATGIVRHAEGRTATIWTRSELWSAESEDEQLKVGDAVEVIGAKGIVLKVRRFDAGTRAPQPPAACR